ncbi:MAG: site-specific DNA-methyltransferase, partial [Acidimicrobiia bacterium]
FIPQLVSEPNVFEVFRHQVAQLGRFYDKLPQTTCAVTVRQSDATDLSWLANGSVDYVFTDPPFGNNIHYADCNIVWEAWLGDLTDNDKEIVVNKSRRVENGGKTVDDYESLLGAAFKEARRIVHSSGRVSIVFHNSDDAVWSALLAAVESADLHQAEVSILDKGQRSQKGYKIRQGELVPFYDLVMTFTPTKRGIPELNGAGEVALDAVREHLAKIDHATPVAFRGVDFLYSVAVASVVRAGKKPVGLSLRAFERLCNEHLERDDFGYALR